MGEVAELQSHALTRLTGYRPIPPAAAAKSLQSCPTLCDPTDGSPPGSPVPGILQARVLEWGAIVFSIRLPGGGDANQWPAREEVAVLEGLRSGSI